MAQFAKPENALKRAEELINVGQKQAALQALHDLITSKRYRAWQKTLEKIMFKYVELCVDMRRGRFAKDGLIQYRIVCQQVNVSSLEEVIKHFMQLSTERAEHARSQAEAMEDALDVEDLEADKRPEDLMLSYVSGEKGKDRSDRELVTPWFKFLWETYRTVLEILRNNSKLEALYAMTAHRAFQFCKQYKRTTEFRRLCEIIRNHLANLNKYRDQRDRPDLTAPESLQLYLDTRVDQLKIATDLALWQEAFRSAEDIHGLMTMVKKSPKPSLMVVYYAKLTEIFWVADSHLYHAYAWLKLFSLQKSYNKNLTQKDLQLIASSVLLAALSVAPYDNKHGSSHLELENEKERNMRMSSLIGFTPDPKRENKELLSRAALLSELASKGVMTCVIQEVKDIYNLVEHEFLPLDLASKVQPLLTRISRIGGKLSSASSVPEVQLSKYIPALEKLVTLRVLQQVSQVYQSMKIETLSKMIPFSDFSVVEKLSVDAVKYNFFAVKVDHRKGAVIFGNEDIESDKVSDHLAVLASSLNKARTLIYPPAKKQSKLGDNLYGLADIVDKEHKRLLARKSIIEKRKEEHERQMLEMEREEETKRLKHQKITEEAERKRLATESTRREEQRIRREIEERELQEAQALLLEAEKRNKKKKRTVLEGDKVTKQTIIELALSEQLKERQEMEKKLQKLAKTMDYMERAKREEEAPLIEQAHEKLFRKLSSETFDGGDFFTVEPCGGGRQRRLVLSAGSMEKESDVFLIDHAWTFRLQDALKQLKEVTGLAQRMAALMCVDLDLDSDTIKADAKPEGEHRNVIDAKVLEILQQEMDRVKNRGSDASAWLELEELDIDDDMLCSLDLSSKFPNLVALNLWGNKLRNVETLVQEITKCTQLKAVWLNENPVLSMHGDDIEHAIPNGIPGLEIYNSRFTRNFSEWALGFCGGIVGSENPDFPSDATNPLKDITILDLSNRCIHRLPEAFLPTAMPSLTHLNFRGNHLGEASTDDLLELLSGFTSLKMLEVDIPGPLGTSAIKILESLPRISILNGVNRSHIIEHGKHIIDSALQPRLPEWTHDEPLEERVIGAMWLYLMTYRLADEEKIDETSVWYVMDELGSALRHSDDANFRVAPFLFMPEGKLASAVSFSVLWPTKDVYYEEECTRDFLFGIGEDKQRSARLTAWFHTPESYFIEELKNYRRLLKSMNHPTPSSRPITTMSLLPSDRRTLQVYTDIPQVEENLTRPEFVLTTEPKNADIIWSSVQVDTEVKNALGLRDNQYTNQFPFEACLVMKHHLAETIRKAQGSPDWLQPTYNLETQLSQLIGDYCLRKRDGSDNLWILKPWNMARTIDTSVTGDLSAIIRLMETGPKICQKYIEHPALFKGKKFDLRFIVLVRSMKPVEVFLADVFWVRLANNLYTLDKSSLFEYETHFTVMNYIGRINHMNISDFVREFEEEHQVNWHDIHERIRKMIRSVFDSAAAVHPEMHCPLSRSMYGVDVMLDHLFMPKLLEVTYCPDCTRACKYDTEAIVGSRNVLRGKDFFNLVFGCLFLNESTNVTPL